MDRLASADFDGMGHELAKGAAEARSRSRPQWVRVTSPDGAVEVREVPYPAPELQKLAARRAEMLTYADLSQLQEADGELAAVSWQRIRREAGEHLQAGHAAARQAEGSEARPYRRALFLELRAALVAEWQPRGVTELMLIDNLTQALMMRNSWLGLCHDYHEPLELPPTYPDPKEPYHERRERERREEHIQRMEAMLPPRMTAAQAIDRATAMVERWDRMANRTIRMLRDLRKQTVVIENHGLVNVAEVQQVNMTV